MDQLSSVGSWRQLLRALCPIDPAALGLGGGSAVSSQQHAEAVGLTVLVVALSTLLYLYTSVGGGGAGGGVAGREGRPADAGEGDEGEEEEEVDLWSGDDEED